MKEGEPKNDEHQEQEISERTSGIMKVVNASPETEKSVLNDIKTELFDNQAVAAIEREKTPEEVEILHGILAKLPDFIKRYGGNPIAIDKKHMHIMDDRRLNPPGGKFRIEHDVGAYSPQRQEVSLFRDMKDSELKFAHYTSHELIHFNSFQSIGLNSADNKDWSIRVMGLTTKVKSGNHEHYFDDINEAITEELAIRFNKKYFGSIPELADEITIRDQYIASSGNKPVTSEEILSYRTEELTADGKPFVNWRIETYPYKEARSGFKDLIKGIFDKNSEQFSSEEEVFDIFAEVYFTGNTLKLARLVEKTYGKGSFRTLGKNTKAKYN